MSYIHRLSQLPRDLIMMSSSHQSSALTSLSLFISTSTIPTSLRGLTASLNWDKIATWIPSSLADMQLLAAPKKKVTPHRKGNRSATKHIRFIPVVSQCSKCDRVFLPHSMPSKCDEDECPAFNLRSRPEHTRLTDENNTTRNDEK